MPTLKLRTVPGYQSIVEELDLTDKASLVHASPLNQDSRGNRPDGSRVSTERAIRRRFRLLYQNPTATQLSTLRRWINNRVLVAVNPNWDHRTRLYTRFSRQDPLTGSPGAIIGPQPTYARVVGTAGAYATELQPNGRLRLIADDIMRFEESNALSAFYPLCGARIFGDHTNQFAESYPRSGNLEWTASGATWAHNANVESNIDGMLGAGLFTGNSGQYIYRDFASYGGAGQLSAGVWVKGSGTVSLQMTGGATIESANLTLQPDAWRLLKLEDVTASGAAIQLRMNSKATVTWCSVGNATLRIGRRIGGHTYNVVSSSSVQCNEDAIYYPFQIPPHTFSIHVGVELPDLVSAGEQVILGLDQGGGNRLVLKYDGTLSKFYFQRRASGTNVQWTPARTAGHGTIISIECDRTFMEARENDVQVGLVAGAAEAMLYGLNVGWDGITDNNGWNGLIFFLRIDEGLTPASELTYISNMYNDVNQIEWTRLTEGRYFEIVPNEDTFPAGLRMSAFDLVEVDSCRTATTERP